MVLLEEEGMGIEGFGEGDVVVLVEGKRRGCLRGVRGAGKGKLGNSLVICFESLVIHIPQQSTRDICWERYI